METYHDRLTRIYESYFVAGEVAPLAALDNELNALLALSGAFALNADLKKKAESLFFLVRAKTFVVYYSENGFEPARHSAMMVELENLYKTCPPEFVKTLEQITWYKQILASLLPIFEGLTDITVVGQQMEKENVNKLVARIADLENRLSVNYTFEPPMECLSTLITNFLSAQKNAFGKRLLAVQNHNFGGLYQDVVSPVSLPVEAEYCPFTLLDETLTAKIQTLNTPFQEEAELAIATYAKAKKTEALALDMLRLIKEDDEAVCYVLDKLIKTRGIVVVFGLNRLLSIERERALIRIVALSKGVTRVFLHDESADKSLYHATQAVPNSGAVMYVFLSMPDYVDVVEELEKKGHAIDREGEAYLKRYGIFLGFTGFNAIVRTEASAFQREVKRYYDARFTKGRTFLEALPNSAVFIDEGWKYNVWATKSHVKAAKPPFIFDYDECRPYLKENVEAILSLNVSLQAKCGMVVNYCLFLGEDVSNYTALFLTDEGICDATLRITTATRLVARLLNVVHQNPIVKVIKKEDFQNKLAIGLCCNGGEEIQYREDFAADAKSMPNTILHEIYHSFQHTTSDGAYCSWWFDELQVVAQRRDEWAHNAKNYLKLESNRNAYHNQIKEADARIFAENSLVEAAAHWAEIDFKN